MNLYEAFTAFPEVAKPIVIKSDMLTLGVRFSEAALASAREQPGILYKGFGHRPYSRSKIDVYSDKIPNDFILQDGTPEGTIIQVRRADDTPYVIDLVDGSPAVTWNGEIMGKGSYSLMPNYYRRDIDGVPMASFVMGHADFLFCSANRYCEYFKGDRECLFCDMAPFGGMQKKGGEGTVAWKDPEKVAEVLDAALNDEPRFRYLMVSGGTVLTQHMGKNDAEYYADFLITIRKRIKHFPFGCLQIGACDDEGWRKLADTGVASVNPNIEVWDRKLFEIICPGKAEVVGYDGWIKRIISGSKFFPYGNINPSFVLGIEMAQPFGFKNVDQAVASTLSGYEFFMKNGVLPRQGNFWVASPLSKMAGQAPVPLEYYIKIGKGYLELRKKNGFATPPVWASRFGDHHGTEFDFEFWHGT